MPVSVSFHNSIFDMRCSKCKRTKEPLAFITNGMLYKTCNVCRAHARRNSRTAIDERVAAAVALGADDDDVSVSDMIAAARESLSALGFNHVNSSSAAASSSSYDTSDYFIAEPEPEPEPDDPDP